MNISVYKNRDKTFQRLISFVDKLPALPQVVNQALEVIDSPNSTAKTVADVIAKDVILSGRILRIANSAFYGFPRRVKSMQDAIIILGFDTVKNLTMAASVHKLFAKKMTGYGIKSGEMWRHSIGCAICAEEAAQRLKLDSDEAFVAGLMHDVGKVVLDRLMIEESKKVLELIIEKNYSFTLAEQTVLGFDHAQIGSRIAIKWNLPKSIVEAIEYHHKPLALKKNPGIAALVRFCDAVCMMYGIGLGGDEFNVEQEEPLLKILNLDKSKASDLMVELGNKTSDLVLKL